MVSESGRGLVADTSKARGWISLGDFTGNTSHKKTAVWTKRLSLTSLVAHYCRSLSRFL